MGNILEQELYRGHSNGHKLLKVSNFIIHLGCSNETYTEMHYIPPEWPQNN